MMDSINSNDFYTKETSTPVPLIDVRETDEFAEAHIPGAVNLPLSTLNTNFSQLDHDTHYYIICRSGRRSQLASQFLSANGYSVTNVEGGMLAWKGSVA
ncbi:rhodanese-like domain-containing protein [Lentilactobacillus curieae]|uniref:Rhodanese-like domain-containing protein n=1 Tax=Lentilactobacillus curieae TaxID=1138822 RepID=A0A1S6QGX4_9LACO|nr:rhodanese-like domain-containing protein [Lentilactobacillus curieae]AQW20852.1 rhodanese-like domain-containing protein [Lentilactobacillus curieae]